MVQLKEEINVKSEELDVRLRCYNEFQMATARNAERDLRYTYFEIKFFDKVFYSWGFKKFIELAMSVYVIQLCNKEYLLSGKVESLGGGTVGSEATTLTTTKNLSCYVARVKSTFQRPNGNSQNRLNFLST